MNTIAKKYNRYFKDDMIVEENQTQPPVGNQSPAPDTSGQSGEESAFDFNKENADADKGDDSTASPANAKKLSDSIIRTLKDSGETAEDILVKLLKSDGSADEVKNALKELKSSGKIKSKKIWMVSADDDIEDEKTGVNDDNTDDEFTEDDFKSKDQEGRAQQQAQPEGDEFAPTGEPAQGQKNQQQQNFMKSDDGFDDDDFDDDDFDDEDDEDEEDDFDDSKDPAKSKATSAGNDIESLKDEIEDIEILLKSLKKRISNTVK